MTEAPLPVTRAVVQDVVLDAPVHIARIETRRITMAPGVVGGRHTHNGHVVGVVESGSVTFQVAGAPAVVLGAGDVFHEPAGTVIERWDAGPEGVVFVGHFPVPAGADPELRPL
ncbi:cupin domain-containing protein [Luteimicrobium subarcticum]|uniref:Cupin domain-containing protein n=1 Tax=Luteimicrobium subarcticum TaxID=620910 RepID=A0A2M8WQY1_9MICO|nr:cupin domain-containing protein [Luteimicrobium subarcticum]PJI93327.1 Cupin domain-containing protein [Luteimicrobium subarcticum]